MSDTTDDMDAGYQLYELYLERKEERLGKERNMTRTTAPPPAPPAPQRPPFRPSPDAPCNAPQMTGVTFGRPKKKGKRIGLYGPGGIGKTTLACMAPGPVAVFDFDDSLGELYPSLKNIGLDILPVQNVQTWEALRSALQSPGWDQVKTILIDSATRAEELAVVHTIKNVPHEKGHRVTCIEGYGYGKGYSHAFDTFLRLFDDLDAHVRAGRNVILIAHDCTATVPNPAGEDYLRYEPRLQSPNSGKASIRLRLREWLDHLFFIGYDIEATKGKATGQGTRTIYPIEMAHCMAKTRSEHLYEPLVYANGDDSLWKILSNQKG